jgi:hypothetical protein
MGVATARHGTMRIGPLTIIIDPLTTAGTLTAITTTVRRTLRRITKGTTIVGITATTMRTRMDCQIGLRWVSNPSPNPKKLPCSRPTFLRVKRGA